MDTMMPNLPPAQTDLLKVFHSSSNPLHNININNISNIMPHVPPFPVVNGMRGGGPSVAFPRHNTTNGGGGNINGNGNNNNNNGALANDVNALQHQLQHQLQHLVASSGSANAASAAGLPNMNAATLPNFRNGEFSNFAAAAAAAAAASSLSSTGFPHNNIPHHNEHLPPHLQQLHRNGGSPLTERGGGVGGGLARLEVGEVKGERHSPRIGDEGEEGDNSHEDDADLDVDGKLELEKVKTLASKSGGYRIYR